MQFNKKWFPVLLVLAVISGYFAFFRNSENTDVKPSDTSTSTSEVDGIQIGNNGNYTIEQVSNEAPTPDLNRKVVFGNGVVLSDEVKKVVTDKILSLQNNLKKDSKDLASWLELGIYQKMAGDYEGASLSWKYVSLVSGNDYISLGNLGDLYGYYIKDRNLSEEYYKKAIKNGPTQAYLYTQLSDLYKNVYKDSGRASAIIDEGLKKLPGDKTLLQYKSNL